MPTNEPPQRGNDQVPRVEKVTTGNQILDRWIPALVDVLNQWFRVGTNRIQGTPVPIPTDADEGKALRWRKGRGWVLEE